MNESNGQPGDNISQILFGLGLVIAIYLSFLFIEIMYKYINRLSMNRTQLLPYRYNTEDRSITISQNPNFPDSKSVYFSNNERSGIEFSYSFYLYVHASTFKQEMGLLHIFHKGYPKQFPLLAPGVYMRSDTNTLRIYMNTYKSWNKYVEVDNFPIGKWVHTVIVCKENALEIFINGNLSKKMPFEGFVPYQNYQDIICFSQRVIKIKTDEDVMVEDCPKGASYDQAHKQCNMQIFGVMKGMISRLDYFSYALGYAEIQQLMNEGPSTKADDSLNTTNVPPYLDDTWWAKGY